MKLKRGDKIGLIALSNGLSEKLRPVMDELVTVLSEMELQVVLAPKLYGFLHASDKEKAQMLMDFYQDEKIAAIFDVSGGDLANGVLPYLDFEIITKSNKMFFGYSDLSVIVNGLFTKTKNETYLYQIRNLVGAHGAQQVEDFKHTFFEEESNLFDFDVEWIQGNQMNGLVVGGNIRCLLKLAGTPYVPDFKDKVLVLESMSGDVYKMLTFLNQYKQLGVFEDISGLILGYFTEMETKQYEPNIIELVKMVVQNEDLPIIKTSKIGHNADSKCIVIGKNLSLKKSK